jgi:NAD(P)H dehydrogenase (quinone)
MNFQTDMDLLQYERETSFNPALPVPPDVLEEQKKINRADVLVFIYPVWWSDCPAKLKGWFDRVWTLGYAYTYEEGAHTASKIKVKKALVICPAGHPEEYLEEIGIAPSMRRIMLNDRLLGVGIKKARMEILGGMVALDPSIRQKNLDRAFELGKKF